MTRFARLLAGAATALALTTAAQAQDAELTILDWAGWEIDGMLQPYVDKHGAKRAMCSSPTMTRRSRRSRPGSRPMSSTPAPPRCRATRKPA